MNRYINLYSWATKGHQPWPQDAFAVVLWRHRQPTCANIIGVALEVGAEHAFEHLKQWMLANIGISRRNSWHFLSRKIGIFMDFTRKFGMTRFFHNTSDVFFGTTQSSSNIFRG
jgi:hypothetical protein